jgi:hypothetical protein
LRDLSLAVVKLEIPQGAGGSLLDSLFGIFSRPSHPARFRWICMSSGLHPRF